MGNFHDPFKQINYLRQTLSQDKKPIGFFLGAGCPYAIKLDGEPLIPDIDGITSKIISVIKEGDKRLNEVFSKILLQLESDGLNSPTIEDILSHIRALKEVAGNDIVRECTKEQLKDLDNEICKQISTLVNKLLPNSRTPFHGLASWIRSINRHTPIEIFTTNYDLLIEQALEETNVPYFDGFAGSRESFLDLKGMEINDGKDLLPNHWARLWKVHGSINWRLNAEGEITRGEYDENRISNLIYPSHKKYDQSQKMPFAAMLDRLKVFLRQKSSTLFIVGYSFSDKHLNEIIVQSLKANPSAIGFAILFGELLSDKYQNALKSALNTPNLNLFAADEALIGTKDGKWKILNPKLDVDLKSNNLLDINEEDDKIELKLGDFLTFGHFLRELIGEREM